jgi:sporulation protein YlmC with PRC-barrel domain
VQLIRDLLDKAVTDRHGHEMGRVDRIIVERRAGAPPRVVAIVVGPSALGERLSRAIGRWTMGLLQGLGAAEGQPLRIDVGQILAATDKVKVDYAFGETAAANVERTLHGIVSRIPGANR